MNVWRAVLTGPVDTPYAFGERAVRHRQPSTYGDPPHTLPSRPSVSDPHASHDVSLTQPTMNRSLLDPRVDPCSTMDPCCAPQWIPAPQ